MTRQTFLQGTLILIFAGMITRFLGFINRIVLARLLGEEGVGLYMMALPTLFLALTLTQLGLPVAIAKRVAEADAKGDQAKIKKILTVSIAVIFISSLTVTIGMILLSPFIATKLMTDQRTLLPLITLCPAIPIISTTSIIKGYFQGKHNMKPQSYALIIEQIVRISSIAILIKLLLPFGIEHAAAGAVGSIILGEIASLLYMISLFKRKKTIKIRNRFFTFLRSGKNTLTELFSIALPTTGSKIISSVSYFLEPILVAQSLAIAGLTTSMATKQYGELTGYVLPLLFLPTFITNSLSIALVPNISEAEAKKNTDLIHYRIHQSIRISFASGALATIILTLFAEPILTYMYGTDHASRLLILMAPFFLLLYIQAPLQAALQALDLAKHAMFNSLSGVACKLIILVLLASNEQFGIMGVAIAMSVGVILVTFLHIAALMKTISFHIPFADIGKMIFLVGITYGIGQLLKNMYGNLEHTLVAFLFMLFILTFIYVILLFALRFITKDELKQIPFIQKFF